MRLAAKRSLDESNKEAEEKAAAAALANQPKKRRVAPKYASSHPSLFVKRSTRLQDDALYTPHHSLEALPGRSHPPVSPDGAVRC